jgi:hypothetical protein
MHPMVADPEVARPRSLWRNQSIFHNICWYMLRFIIFFVRGTFKSEPFYFWW